MIKWQSDSGNKRTGKQRYDEDLGRNISEDTHLWYEDGEPTEMDLLIKDYYRQKRFIKWQKKHWLPPKEKKK